MKQQRTPNTSATESLDDLRLVQTPEVLRLTGLSRTTLWRLEGTGRFPRRRLVSPGRRAWRYRDIQDWLLSREPA
jgi:prophage regulatory protein